MIPQSEFETVALTSDKITLYREEANIIQYIWDTRDTRHIYALNVHLNGLKAGFALEKLS